VIQSNELRLGNKVYTVDRSKEIHLPVPIPFTILTIGIFGVAGIFPHQSAESVRKWAKFKIIDLSPIPLTEEWLLRFGFERNEATEVYPKGYFRHNNIPFEFSENSLFLTTPQGDDKQHICEVKFVHKMQNFYFALTEEELTFKN
jgi:hypothetical protein